jgi:hypothetical protein
MSARLLRAFVALLGVFPLTALCAAADANEPVIDFTWGVKIPMRDGVTLNATIYKPHDTPAPQPVILSMTPYIADGLHDRGVYFAKHGYVFAAVDVRGRGNSGGELEPLVHDPQDGHDAVEWLATQPWCNGKVAMWGGSYGGFNQWATLKELPPHLATIGPAAAAHPGVDFPCFGGFFTPYALQWLSFTSGTTGNGKLYNDDAFWDSKFKELYDRHEPFNTLDAVVGNSSTVFQTWLKHRTPDAYWDATVPASEQYARLDVPILTVTGHYDADQMGALEYYRRHMRYGSPAGREKHYLIIGPWDHAGTRTPKREFKALKLGEASVVDLSALHVAWYDWTLKDGPKPAFLKQRVAYYVPGAGAEAWKYADALESISNETRSLCLHSTGRADDVFASGSLTAVRPDGETPDAYVYDPLDTRPLTPPDQESGTIANPYTNETLAMSLSGRGLVYHTTPLPEAFEITGTAKLTLWIALDVPDTDFWVGLYEVLPDGGSIWLAADWKRARYRESLAEPKLVTPGKIERYVFDTFNFFSRRVSAGSRLRLIVLSPNTPYVEKNYNAGGNLAEESGRDARTAHVQVYHDADHPSALELPIVK